MRFNKGSNVEVFSKKEVSTGAWVCAEVVSGNGPTYSVKYGCFQKSKEPVVERVPRKAIRPCPPPVRGADDWVPGDLVEAFHNFSWKMARIVKVMDGDIFLVRILGLSDIWVHKSLLRVRQCWQDDKWFIVGKGDIFDMPMVEKKTNKKIKQHLGVDSFLVEKNTERKIADVVSRKILKRRSPLGLYDLEAHPIAAQKKRLIEKGGSHQQIYSPHQSSTLEMVDTVVYPNVGLGENHRNSSFDVATAEFSILEASSRNDSFLIDLTTSVDTDGCSSSVGSCNSMDNDAHNLPFRCYTKCGNNSEDYYNDAELSCQVQYEKEGCSFYSGKKSGLEFHSSGLHVYRSAIEDLYALGPLSWEDEAKLTNLRHVLHISDDEHLMLLRNLISANRMLFFR